MLKNFFKIAYRHQIKEIGVRKVSSAFIKSIANLLSKDFIKLVIMSIVIASTVAGWAMNKWLDGYNYHIKISCLIFIDAGLPTIVIVVVMASLQAIKAAKASLVKSLRTE